MNNKINKKFLTKKELDNWARYYSTLKEKQENEENQWLIFTLGNEKFSILIDYLDEISTIQNGVGIKNCKANIIGLMNLRGETVVIADLGKLIGIRNTPEPEPEQRILVISDQNGCKTGFLVDNVKCFAYINESDISKYISDEASSSQFIKYIAKFKEELVACIDVPAILNETWN